MTELAKQNWLWLESNSTELETLKVVIDDGSKAAKLVCTNNQGDLVPLLTQNSFVADFRVKP